MANTAVYGFHTLEDIFNNQLSTLDIPVVQDALFAAMEAYAAEWSGMMDLLIERTTQPRERVRMPGSGTLQPLDDNGVPVPTRSVASYMTAYPMYNAGDALATTRKARAKMTVGQLNANVAEVMRKDYDWNIRHALAAIFDSSSYDFVDENDDIGTLTILPLANGDTVVYPKVGGAPATDTHYLADANAISDSNNHIATIIDELEEHPENSGLIVVYVASDLVPSIEALSDFIPARSTTGLVQYGTATDLTADEARAFIGFGDKIIGTVGDALIVRARRIPSTYMIGVATGAGPVLGMREEPEAALQGLSAVPVVVNSNIERVDFYRHAGYGVKRRYAAVVFRVGNGSYAVPTGFDAPLSA